ncbi:unnamed protein product [Adineta ricciae]|uniref:Uncharacterized protein n=1 Tax=Adineta ricciae TaxID=249248 RepID=A0A815WHC2_ADIRI|nr:unnamed protein product [Adineta ricciae]CAF1545331.1 unnamed protein product [Adineta ricciae]
MSNGNSSSFVRNVEMEDEDFHLWISNCEFGSIAVNTCLAIIYFYNENGVEEVLLRHTSPVHFSAINELLRDTRAAIKSTANIDASLYFGMLANDDLSARVAIELKEKSQQDAS